nr:immunoglobulin mu heavy chain [Bos taurus]
MSDKAVGWVRQAPGKALEWLGSIDTSINTGYNPGLKSRLSITKDNSKSQVSLSVSSVTSEDSATYYCTTVHQKTIQRSTCPDGYTSRGDCCGKVECSGSTCDLRPTVTCAGYRKYVTYSHTYTYEWNVDTWGQGLLVTVSSEGE